MEGKIPITQRGKGLSLYRSDVTGLIPPTKTQNKQNRTHTFSTEFTRITNSLKKGKSKSCLIILQNQGRQQRNMTFFLNAREIKIWI